jgi:ATP-binding cassette, subfamily B, bacterial CvaB/MchF/RaxB
MKQWRHERSGDPTESRLTIGWRSRLRPILQTESAECGLACLAMVAGWHGYRTDLATLRRRFSISLKGATLKQLIDVAGQVSLASRPLRLEIAELRNLKTPCILHWDLNHFVVLTRVASRHIEILDPAQGERRLRFEEASQHFTGVALELTPTQAFAPCSGALMGSRRAWSRSLPWHWGWRRLLSFRRSSCSGSWTAPSCPPTGTFYWS